MKDKFKGAVHVPKNDMKKINDNNKIARQNEGAKIINMAFANARVAVAA